MGAGVCGLACFISDQALRLLGEVRSPHQEPSLQKVPVCLPVWPPVGNAETGELSSVVTWPSQLFPRQPKQLRLEAMWTGRVQSHHEEDHCFCPSASEEGPLKLSETITFQDKEIVFSTS